LLDGLKGQTTRLARLADDLLLVADTEADEYRPTLAPLSLDDVVARVAAEGRPRAELRELALTYAPAPRPLRVVADEGLIARAVANLLDNAIAYTPPGGHIAVWLTDEGARAAVRVRDTGPGLRPGEQEQIFARAYRGEAGSARRGHGLGLAIVKRVADLHGGQVCAESAAGGGTTFTFLLPTRASPPPAAP
jgi:two-component system sensor histidine kinase BaeS